MIRQLSLILLCILQTLILIAQPPSSGDIDPSLNLMPPSPSAAGLAKYVDFPISYNSGTPQISIPIHTLSGRGIDVPISLSYHAGGVRVDDIASTVGLGWSLDAGGAVTRTVVGKADERPDGFLQRGGQIPYPINLSTNFNDLQQFAEGHWDGQPDVFNFNVGAYSGKFVLESNNVVRLIPHQDLKVSYTICTSCSYPLNGSIISFKITTPDGMIYTFGNTGAVEYSTTSSYNISGGNGACNVRNFDIPVATSWYLRSIKNPKTNDQVDFYYSPKEVTYDLSYNESFVYTLTNIVPTGCSSTPSSTKCVTTKVDDGVILDSIVSQEGRVVFVNANGRSDIGYLFGNTRLSEIHIKGKTNGLLKKFKLVQNFVTSSGSTPSTKSDSKKRMYLDEVEEYSKTNVFVNQYSFSYLNRTALPPRLSFKQDHWGYYNGKANSQFTPMPYPNLELLNRLKNLFTSFNPADRSVDGTKASYGVLNQVTYPTGGTANYIFEGNEIGICDNITTKEEKVKSAYAQYTSSNGGQLKTEYFTIDHGQLITIDYDVLMIGFRQYGAAVRLFNDATNYLIYHQGGVHEFNSPIELDGSTTLWLTPGTYRLEAQVFRGADPNYPYPFNSNPEHANIIVRYIDEVTSFVDNDPTGGIRVQQVTYDDGDNDPSNNIVKKLDYNKMDGSCDKSTAFFLGRQPQYQKSAMSTAAPGNSGCSFNVCPFSRLSSSSIASLTSHGGKVIAYNEVWEWQGANAENGQKYFKFQNFKDSNSELGPNALNIYQNSPMIDRSYMSGKLIEEKMLDNNGNVVSERLWDYEFFEPTNQHKVKGIFATKMFDLPCTQNAYYECDGVNNEGDEFYYYVSHCNQILNTLHYNNCDTFFSPCWNQPAGTIINNLSALDEYSVEWYDAVSQWVYLKSETSRQYALDGSGSYVETVTNYSYDIPNGRHTFPTRTSFVNSDGKTNTTIYRYAPELTDAMSTSLTAWNIISTPIETELKVNNPVIGGTKMVYSNFDNSGLPTTSTTPTRPPLLHEFAKREVTWNAFNKRVDNGWQVQATIDEYDPIAWLPKKITQRGWPSETYTWTDGLVTQKSYENYTWSYTYEPNSRLLSSMTDMDGQVTNYNYDGSMRLQSINARNGNVTTAFTYHYKQNSSDKNYVKVRTDFTASSYSSYTWDEQIEYMDGLGRTIQTVDRGQSWDWKDVVISTTYDAFGRPHKVYDKVESPYGDGRYYTIPTSTPYTFTEYYSNPLSQPHKVTPPDWYATQYLYGTNSSGEVQNWSGSGSYAANTLLKQIVIDPNGNKSVTFTDKKGRQLLSQKTNSNSTSIANTYYVHDDKDRLKQVVPPGATPSSSGLIYKYLYDTRDRLIEKKVPDANPTYMKYNNRNLLVLTQDGNMKLSDPEKWMLTKYDNYGRPTQTGFYEGTNPNPDANLNFSELLSENCYDGMFCSGSTTTSSIYKGKIRESRVKVLDNTNTWINKRYYYDSYGRINYTLGNHHLQPSSTYNSYFNYSYDFADNVTYTMHRQRDAANVYRYYYTINDYNHSGLAYKARHRYGSSGAYTQLSYANFTHKDQLEFKRLGPNLQQIDFAYNAQGWLERMNSSWLGGTNIALPEGCATTMPNPGNNSNYQYNDLFYLELKYDQLQAGLPGTIQKNGNIAQAIWRVRGRERQSYTYYYDYLDRLTTANYRNINDNNSASGFKRYDVTASYDDRGNILSLQRYGRKMSGNCAYFNRVDILSYTYTAGTNKVKRITDNASSFYRDELFKPNTSAGDYLYDVNGNMTFDPHKNMSITYNHLNLPQLITFSGTQKEIEFLYNATGTKLRKTVRDGSIILYTQDYVNGIEYKDGTVEAVYHAEGRMYNENVDNPSAGIDFRYEFAIRDHLGNTRLLFTDKDGDGTIEQSTNPVTNEVIQELHYYPFGLNMEGRWMDDPAGEHRYQYNGKEWNSDFDLNWLDYGARWYDASIARFSSIDPLAEDYSFQSPYAYAANNPVTFIDLFGLGPIYGPDGKLIGYEVEEGQGPTQIAQDLNENYSCELTCEVGWTEIVYNNIAQFQNVVDGDGEIDDKYNGDYKEGNIAPGDILDIEGGIDLVDNTINDRLGQIDKSIDSLREEIRKLDSVDTDATLDNYRDLSGPGSWESGGSGSAAGRGVKNGFTIAGSKGENTKAIKSLQKEKKNLIKKKSKND